MACDFLDEVSNRKPNSSGTAGPIFLHPLTNN